LQKAQEFRALRADRAAAEWSKYELCSVSECGSEIALRAPARLNDSGAVETVYYCIRIWENHPCAECDCPDHLRLSELNALLMQNGYSEECVNCKHVEIARRLLAAKNAPSLESELKALRAQVKAQADCITALLAREENALRNWEALTLAAQPHIAEILPQFKAIRRQLKGACV